MNEDTTFVGLDVHKRSIQVAMLLPQTPEPVEWTTPHDPKGVRGLVRRLQREGQGTVRCAYEAGPCGYALKRTLEAAGVACQVVAPGLIPVKPGERIKTDRRDARKLARYLRSGDLTEVHPPTPAEEAVRDLVRARTGAQQDLTRARHQLGKYLLRHGRTFTGGRKAWTGVHRRWLRGLRFEDPVAQTVFDAYLRAVEIREEHLRELDEAIETVATLPPYAAPVGALRCMRGIDTRTAMTIIAELHGIGRFPTARALMAYLGLVPAEHSSGETRRRGGITKTGNTHVRRVLVEAAWHARHRPAVSVKLKKRREGQPGWAIAIADRAQRRLHRKWWRMVHAGKPTQKATVAVARELVGFVWEALQTEAAQRT